MGTIRAASQACESLYLPRSVEGVQYDRRPMCVYLGRTTLEDCVRVFPVVGPATRDATLPIPVSLLMKVSLVAPLRSMRARCSNALSKVLNEREAGAWLGTMRKESGTQLQIRAYD